MKTRYIVALSMLAGAAIAGTAIQGLHAQAKPPFYTASEIQITNMDAYTKEFVSVAQASIKAAHWREVPCRRTRNVARRSTASEPSHYSSVGQPRTSTSVAKRSRI